MALHDGYYQGILQLRDPADEVVDFIIKNLRDKKDVQVSKVVKVRGGIDFYITNNKSLQKLGKKLILSFISVTGLLYLSRETFLTFSMIIGKVAASLCAGIIIESFIPLEI